jgi:hypothetical protein
MLDHIDVKQSLKIIDLEDNFNPDIIEKLLYLECTLLLVYDEFLPSYCKYIFLPKLFLLPRSLYLEIISSIYSIENNTIRWGNNIVLNNCTLNNKYYLPESILDSKKLEHFRSEFDKYLLNFNRPIIDLIDSLSDIKIEVNNYDNIFARLERLKEYTNLDLANYLKKLFNENIESFNNVSSLSILTHQFEKIGTGFNSSDLDILIKLSSSIHIYDFYGYQTYLDTFTKYYFYSDYCIKHQIIFIKLLKLYPEPMIFFGILNFHLSRNINKITNQHDKIYKKIMNELYLKVKEDY